jgi:hypothetical protein
LIPSKTLRKKLSEILPQIDEAIAKVSSGTFAIAFANNLCD